MTNALFKPANGSVTKLLNRLPRLRTPRPDLIFGLKQGALTVDQRDLALYLGGHMRPGLYHPFFVLEATNVSGSIEEAEIQSCRAGAAMVYCRRRFNMEAEKSTETQTSGADLDSFAFTLALVPTYAQIYVHWAEVGAVGEAVSYRMKVMGIYVMRTKQSVNSLRQAIQNIHDWGLSPTTKGDN